MSLLHKEYIYYIDCSILSLTYLYPVHCILQSVDIIHHCLQTCVTQCGPSQILYRLSKICTHLSDSVCILYTIEYILTMFKYCLQCSPFSLFPSSVASVLSFTLYFWSHCSPVLPAILRTVPSVLSVLLFTMSASSCCSIAPSVSSSQFLPSIFLFLLFPLFLLSHFLFSLLSRSFQEERSQRQHATLSRGVHLKVRCPTKGKQVLQYYLMNTPSN